jgi:phosphoglycerate kinase
MDVTTNSMETWIQKLLGAAPGSPRMALKEFLDGIPRLEALADLPRGTRVLVRGDTDAKPGKTIGEGDIRLRSMLETLEYGRSKGWVQILFGHIGRDPKGSLNKVRDRLAELLKADVTFIADWVDTENNTVLDAAAKQIQSAAPGSFILLENTRKYPIETVLWKTKPDGVAAVAGKLAKFANDVAQKIAKVYVHEAFSAGSLDASSVVVPATMDRVALGSYEAGQFVGPLMDCLNAQLVVSSGLKIDKLDDLEAMISRGKIRWVFSAGSLANGLKKAAAELEGKQFDIGVAQDPAHSDKPYFIPQARIEQAKKLIAEGRQKGIEFVMPVDFVLQDGKVSKEIGPGNQQLDTGPETAKFFEQKVGEFIAAGKKQGGEGVAFHNGVFGMFEDPRFEEGTRQFVKQLKRMKDAGVKVYVGGGEGGKALEKYGQEDWVTHNFTAGGTVLNALGSEPVPYLVALWMAAKR